LLSRFVIVTVVSVFLVIGHYEIVGHICPRSLGSWNPGDPVTGNV
jgi:hypothetical protein